MRPIVMRTLAVLLLVLAGTAEAARETPPGAVTRAQFKGWQRTGEVMDLAQVLDEAVEERLRNQAREVRAKSGVDLVVATLPGLPSGDWDKELAALAKRWKVGGREKKSRNTGVLLALMRYNEGWVLLWVYPGTGSHVVSVAERGRVPSFVGPPGKEVPLRRLTAEFRVLTHLYAAYYGFALEPSGPRPGPVAPADAEGPAVIDDPLNLVDARTREWLTDTMDSVRRHTGSRWLIKTTPGPGTSSGALAVDSQAFGEASRKIRLQERHSGDLVAILRASDGFSSIDMAPALRAALDAEPSAYEGVPLSDRAMTQAKPGLAFHLSLRDFARRYAAHGGWALSPRWTKRSGLPPPRPDASVTWSPAPPAPPPAQAHAPPEPTGVARTDTSSGRGWSSGSAGSSVSSLDLGRALMGAYLPLIGLIWFWLTARALVVDRRGALLRLVLVCVLGSPCWTSLITFLSAGLFSSMRDKYHPSLAALASCLAGIAVSFLVVEGVANPTFKNRRGSQESYFAPREPTFSARWQRPGRMLCWWGMMGTGVGCLAFSIAFGFSGGDLVGLNSGLLQPASIALSIAIAIALVGVVKTVDAERGRER